MTTFRIGSKHLILCGENMFESINIKGFRGFADKQELKLAKPHENNRGSGLTVIVGPNNGGKSTIIESFKLMSSGIDIDFTEDQRNKSKDDGVEIVLSSDDESQTHTLKTIYAGGYNYTVELKSTAFSASVKRQALQLYLEGLGFRSIGRVLGVSHVSVQKLIKKFGQE